MINQYVGRSYVGSSYEVSSGFSMMYGNDMGRIVMQDCSVDSSVDDVMMIEVIYSIRDVMFQIVVEYVDQVN